MLFCSINSIETQLLTALLNACSQAWLTKFLIWVFFIQWSSYLHSQWQFQVSLQTVSVRSEWWASLVKRSMTNCFMTWLQSIASWKTTAYCALGWKNPCIISSLPPFKWFLPCTLDGCIAYLFINFNADQEYLINCHHHQVCFTPGIQTPKSQVYWICCHKE